MTRTAASCIGSKNSGVDEDEEADEAEDDDDEMGRAGTWNGAGAARDWPLC